VGDLEVKVGDRGVQADNLDVQDDNLDVQYVDFFHICDHLLHRDV
jgi:hypothetical protein